MTIRWSDKSENAAGNKNTSAGCGLRGAWKLVCEKKSEAGSKFQGVVLSR